MISTLKQDGFAIKRGFFEKDVQFKGEFATVLLVAYEKASQDAARTARQAISNGGAEKIKRAQWYEAIAQTIERSLSCLPHTSCSEEFENGDKIELPDSPSFE